ncbi:DUF6531 domain-containing protein [Streptomyces sp. NPDC093970]|uniref:DUF6531 domain-containing protein n=1 Tax=Streptomyces sp. NPDC093970 TaxID=3155076 RepID=UPI00342AD930
MSLAVKGLGKNARGMLEDGAKGAFNRLKSKVKGCGDPVDVATGEMFLAETDVSLPGTLPLAFARRVSSGYRCGWWFGPGWTSTVDQRLEIGDEEIVFVTDDGMLLLYRVADAADGSWFPVTGPRLSLVRETDGTYRVDDPHTGLTRRFAPLADGTAHITEIADRNANRIAFEYDTAGTPLAMRHSGGYHLAFTTDEGRVTSTSLVGGAEDGSDVLVRSYGYTDGSLTEVVNSSGRALTFTYDERLRVTSWTDRNGSRYSYAYDGRDRCVAQRGEAGHLAGTFAYDGVDSTWPGCRVTTYATGDGAVSRFVVNDDSQVVAETDPLGNTTRTAYDRDHHLLSRTDALGAVTRYENNAVGKPTRITLPDSGVVTVEYDTLQLPVRVCLPDGTSWEHAYDLRGNRISSTAPDGAHTRFTYDDHGSPASVTDPLGATTRVRCDRAGLRVETVSALGDRSTRTYDAFGRLGSLTDPLGRTTSLRWTVEGRIARVLAPDGTEESWSYDGEGNCTSHTRPGGARTTFEYGPFDLLTAQTAPDGGRYEFDYDTSLRLTDVSNPLGLHWSYTYDAAGRLVAESDFDEQRTVYEHDAVGRVGRRVNPAGQSVDYAYDVMGRLVARTVGGETTTYGRDAMGRLVRAVGRDCDLRFERDRAGRTLAERVDGRSLVSTYDAAGRRVERGTPSGARARYSYDAVGRTIGLVSSGHVIEFANDAAGQEISRLIDGSLRLSQSWGANGRLAEQRWDAGDRLVQSRMYDYGQDGHLTGITDALDGPSALDIDVMGRVRGVEAADREESYVYDVAGHIAAATWAGYPGAEAAAGDRAYTGTRLRRAGATRYVHDEAGRVVERRRTRLSRKPDIWRYSWDAEDRLTSVVTPDGTVWRYLYDPLGRRTAKERLGDDGRTVVERTDFTWDGATLAEQTTYGQAMPQPVTLTWDHDGTRPLTQTERLTDAATQQEIDSRFFAIVTDLVGTPTELVDPHGSVAWRARRTAWGATFSSRDCEAYTPLRFPGQYQDFESGLHYNYHRYYDPETARYASLDPLGLAPAPDPYGYVTNPWRQIDPLGLMSCEEETVVLYHGSKNWTGDKFSLGSSGDLQRQYTPDTGIYLTDDFSRAATQYAGPEGVVVRTEVPKSFAESVLREHSGPAGKQPEYFVNTPEGLDILNAGSPRALPQRDAVIQHMMGLF